MQPCSAVKSDGAITRVDKSRTLDFFNGAKHFSFFFFLYTDGYNFYKWTIKVTKVLPRSMYVDFITNIIQYLKYVFRSTIVTGTG